MPPQPQWGQAPPSWGPPTTPPPAGPPPVYRPPAGPPPPPLPVYGESAKTRRGRFWVGLFVGLVILFRVLRIWSIFSVDDSPDRDPPPVTIGTDFTVDDDNPDYSGAGG
jgi:hypothetical protein